MSSDDTRDIVIRTYTIVQATKEEVKDMRKILQSKAEQETVHEQHQAVMRSLDDKADQKDVEANTLAIKQIIEEQNEQKTKLSYWTGWVIGVGVILQVLWFLIQDKVKEMVL